MRLSLKSLGMSAITILLAFAVVAVAHAETSARLRQRPTIEVPRPAPPGTRIAVLGDSITYLSEGAFRDRFAARNFDVSVISGIPGIRSDERVTEGPALLAGTAPRILVLELGTNDVGTFLAAHPTPTPAERAAHATAVADNQRRIVDAVGSSVQCVVVVNVSGNTMSTPANQVAHDESAALADWAHADPRVRIADWDAVLGYELASGEPRGSMTTDMVHPTPYGATRLARLVEGTIDTCALT